jgi:hypothetical protein
MDRLQECLIPNMMFSQYRCHTIYNSIASQPHLHLSTINHATNTATLSQCLSPHEFHRYVPHALSKTLTPHMPDTLHGAIKMYTAIPCTSM